MIGVTFPVKYTDRLPRLNQKNPGKRDEKLGDCLADRFRPGRPRAGVRDARRPQGRSGALVHDDDALAEHIRENVAGMFHVAGTCRMGAVTDRDAVVDRRGRVRGFEGLRVVDASIMPTVPRANTNIPTIMVAEKIAAAITAVP